MPNPSEARAKYHEEAAKLDILIAKIKAKKLVLWGQYIAACAEYKDQNGEKQSQKIEKIKLREQKEAQIELKRRYKAMKLIDREHRNAQDPTLTDHLVPGEARFMTREELYEHLKRIGAV